MGIKLGYIYYGDNTEEATVKWSKDFDGLHNVMKLDTLQDILCETEKKYNEVLNSDRKKIEEERKKV